MYPQDIIHIAEYHRLQIWFIEFTGMNISMFRNSFTYFDKHS